MNNLASVCVYTTSIWQILSIIIVAHSHHIRTALVVSYTWYLHYDGLSAKRSGPWVLLACVIQYEYLILLLFIYLYRLIEPRTGGFSEHHIQV